MVTAQEARACRHAFMTPEHPLTLGRALGPLMEWLALFVILILSGLAGHSGGSLQERQMVTEAEAR
jgi:hypothetical protein